MIVVSLILLTGAIQFVEQELDSYTGNYTKYYYDWIYHKADLDRDGQVDLLFPTFVRFQRDGLFPSDAQASVPRIAEKPYADIFEGSLYLRFPDRLVVYQWQEDAWLTVQDQLVSWPSPAPTVWESDDDKKVEALRFEPFLVDLDGDTIPEIVLPGQEGLFIYRQMAGAYQMASVLEVFPPLKLALGGSSRLLSMDSRRINYPYRWNNCSYVVDGNRLTVFMDDAEGESSSVYKVWRYRIESEEEGFKAVPETEEPVVTEPLPWTREVAYFSQENTDPYRRNCFTPIRMDNASTLGYYRITRGISSALAYPTPMLEISVAIDNGKSFRSFRTHYGWAPDSQVLVDVNGDGRLDIVTRSTDLFDGGLRETINRILNSKRIVEEVNVYYQDARGQFSQRPDIASRFAVTMHAPMSRGGYSQHSRITGDFNGNGRKDVAVMAKPDEIAIHLFADSGFASRPAAAATIPERASWILDDVDGNGRADILVLWSKRDEESNIRTYHRKIYLNREAL